MNKLILTVGLPRSGKSTWAKQQGLPIVRPDAIRMELYGQRFWERGEKMVWSIVDVMVRSLFTAGNTSVILDATNLSVKYRWDWYSSEWETYFKTFDTDVDTCVKRAKEAGYDDLVDVIIDMNDLMDELDEWETKMRYEG